MYDIRKLFRRYVHRAEGAQRGLIPVDTRYTFCNWYCFLYTKTTCHLTLSMITTFPKWLRCNHDIISICMFIALMSIRLTCVVLDPVWPNTNSFSWYQQFEQLLNKCVMYYTNKWYKVPVRINSSKKNKQTKKKTMTSKISVVKDQGVQMYFTNHSQKHNKTRNALS